MPAIISFFLSLFVFIVLFLLLLGPTCPSSMAPIRLIVLFLLLLIFITTCMAPIRPGFVRFLVPVSRNTIVSLWISAQDETRTPFFFPQKIQLLALLADCSSVCSWYSCYSSGIIRAPSIRRSMGPQVVAERGGARHDAHARYSFSFV